MSLPAAAFGRSWSVRPRSREGLCTVVRKMMSRSIMLLAAILFAAAAVTFSLRYIGVDQAHLLGIAQQYLLGRRLYVDLLDFHPPTNTFLHAAPLVLHGLTG